MTSNNDYLRFSAYSIKDLITRKLSDDSNFTDQIYEGSNLAILIDIVSYMYQCLMYNLNNAASEAMWSDTQIYENINRLCKFIGYNPKGFNTATCIFTLNTDTDNKLIGTTIPRYACIDTGKVDKQGKKIFYSTHTDKQITYDNQYSTIFYNGRWKLYSTIFVSTGDPYQTFILNGLYSDSASETPKYIQNDMIHVYVDNDNNIQRWQLAEQGIFTDNRVENGSRIYNYTDQIYNLRLNEDKTYELMFGNDFNGRIPPKGSKIYIFYLDSNGPDGILDINEVKVVELKHDNSLFGMSTELYNRLFNNNERTEFGTWTNTHSSTAFAEEETVDEIRHNAPQWFKLGNRLVTADDWEYYIKNVFRKSNVIDVKCQNNWGYISSFYRWLYNLGVKEHENGKYYITQNKLTKNAKFSDASDVNNVYLWIKMRDDADIYTEIFDEKVQSIKMLTQEPVYLKPLNVCFCISAQSPENARLQYFDDAQTNNEFDPDCHSYLEITVDDNMLYSISEIHTRISRIIEDFFDERNFELGALVNYNDLTTKILEINGVVRIRTVYHNNEDKNGEIERIVPGISFATWTEGFIDLGDDLDISNTSRSLEVFQFPKLYQKNKLINRIKIIKKSLNMINTVQY